MKIKIINKFAYVPSNDTDAIDVPEKILVEDIAVTKCFDPVNNCVIDYNNSEDIRISEIRDLRCRREIECFSIINRGQCWYNTLTEQQKLELQVWYQAWLDVTETLVEPTKPTWLK